jgi:hypothetical protein
MRRASRALERQPRVTAAMVAAMSAQDPTTAPIKRHVNETLRAIIADAAHGQEVPDLDDVVRALGAAAGSEDDPFAIGGPGLMRLIELGIARRPRRKKGQRRPCDRIDDDLFL